VNPRRSSVLAGFAALGASAGDLVMLLVANGAHFGIALPAPYSLLGVGAALGVGLIPVYAVGYFAVAQALFSAAPRAAWTVRLGGALAAAIGTLIHAVTAVAIFGALRSEPRGAPAPEPIAAIGQRPLLTALWAAAAIAFVAANAPLLWRGLRGPEKWALANPLVTALALGALGTPFEPGRFFLLPAAPNLAHALFFALTARRLGTPSS
jgi:hypothetical protein